LSTEIRTFGVVEKKNNTEVSTGRVVHWDLPWSDALISAYLSIMSEKHFFEQRKHAESYLIPFLERNCPNFRSFRVLDVGCAEAGFLDALHTARIAGMGLELEVERIALSRRFNPELDIIEGDITDPDIVSRINRRFDLVVIRDVIEHIQERDRVFEHLNALLQPDGFIYVTFPPRFSPFGGHQQNGKSVLRKIPWLHLLPPPMLRALGRAAGEDPHTVESVITQARLGLTIRRFEELIAANRYRIRRKELFLFRPVFHVRYGLPAKHLPDIPVVREFFALGCECLLQKAPAQPAV